jgi:hypothetical protein
MICSESKCCQNIGYYQLLKSSDVYPFWGAKIKNPTCVSAGGVFNFDPELPAFLCSGSEGPERPTKGPSPLEETAIYLLNLANSKYII